MPSPIRFRSPPAVAAATLVLGMFGATAGYAQSSGSQEGANQAVLEEIVVYSRKRAENMQDVPIAITAFSLDEIQSAGLRDAVDVAALTPGFNMATLFGGDGSTPVIRGLSTTIGEPNVGFFVDGVYMGSRQTMTAILGNFIQSIEVAKGPQSALYGRNTFGGAVNYVTRQPSGEFEGDVEAIFGSDGKQSVRATFGGPFGDSNFSYRIGALYDEFDGYYTNELTGGNLDSRESTGILGAILWQGDNADIALNVVVDNTDDGDSPLQFVENNDVFFPFGPFPPDFQLYSGELPDITSGYAVTPGGVERDQIFTSLNIDWDFGGATFTSITGYNDFDHDRAGDDDYEARELHFATTDNSVTEVSQEFRLTSNSTQGFRWMAGIYGYSREDTTNLNSSYVGFLFPIFGGTGTVTTQNTDDLAVFGSVGFDLTDSLTITLSGRYGKEEKDVVAVDTDLGSAASFTFADSGDWSAFLPRLTIDWRIHDSHMAYASYALSEKSGGFNTITAAGAILPEERTYEPESSDNYELGLKSSFAGGKITSNIAVYYINWTDQIVRALGANNAVLNANAGETTSRGVEVELFARATEKLNLRIGLSYNDSKYDEYIFGALAGLGVNPDLSGATLQYTPEWTGNISLNYIQPLNNSWEWFSRIDWDYLDEQTAVQTGTAFVGSSNRLNLNTGFGNDHWQVKFWAYNLLENEGASSGVFLTNPAVVPDLFVFGSRPGFQVFQGLVTGPQLRSYGVTLKYDF